MFLSLRKTLKLAALFFSGILAVQSTAWAISNNYAEILVQNLRIGHSYSMTKLVNIPLIVGNSNAFPTKIKVEVGLPEKGYLKPGFEPVPDISWIKLETDIVTVPAQGTAKVDVEIAIPNNQEFLGKKYQAAIGTTEMREGPGVVVNFAVKGKLLFTIAPAEAIGSGRKAVAKTNLNFKITPGKVVLTNVPLGKKVSIASLQGMQGKNVIISNPNASKLNITWKLLDAKDPLLELEPGFQMPPSMDFLTFPTSKMILAPKHEGEVEFYLQIPDQEANAGKSYQFVVAFGTEGAVAGTRFLQILVTTQAAKKAEAEGNSQNAAVLPEKTKDQTKPGIQP